MVERTLEFIYSKWIFLAFILLVGLFGNLIGLIVFLHKDRRKLPSYNIYITLAIMDSFSLVFQIGKDWLFHFSIDLFKLSYFSCKFLKNIDYCIPSVSGWLLVGISVDRFISIRFSKAYITKKILTQRLIILTAFVSNMITYTPLFIYAEKRTNISNISLDESDYGFSECNYFENENLVENIDLIYATLVPFLFLFTFSSLLIFVIFKSRLKFPHFTNRQDRNRLKKDVKFAISSIFFNLFFFIFHILTCIYSNERLTIEYDISLWVYYVSFCVNFYILFACNSIFRKKIFFIFRFKTKHCLHMPTNLTR